MTRLLALSLVSTLAFPSIAAAAEPVAAPTAAAEAQPAAAAPVEVAPAAAEPAADAAPTSATDPFASEPASEPATSEPPAPVLVTPTTVAAPTSPVRPTPKLPPSGEAMLITGASMFGTMYLATSFAGVVKIDDARELANDEWADEDRKRDAGDDLNRGRALTIPLAGPFIAMRFTDSAKSRYGLAVNGSVQVVGLALAVVGAVRHKKYRAAKRRWHMSASADATGGQVGMQVRF